MPKGSDNNKNRETERLRQSRDRTKFFLLFSIFSISVFTKGNNGEVLPPTANVDSGVYYKEQEIT